MNIIVLMLNWYYQSTITSTAAYHQYFYAQEHSRQLYTLPFLSDNTLNYQISF